MRRIAALALSLAGLACAPALAVRPWSTPDPIPGSSGVGYPYDVALLPDGRAAVAFVRDGVRVAIRLPGGRWSQAHRVSTGDTAVTAPDIATTGSGELLVAWTQSTVVGEVPVGRNSIRVAIRSPAGVWSPPRTVGGTEHFVDGEMRLATNRRGDAVLGWRGLRDTHDVLRAAFRPAGGWFGKASSLGEAGSDLRLRINSRGGAYAAWTRLRPPSFVRSSVRLAVRSRYGHWSKAQTIAGADSGGAQIALAPGRRLVIAWRGSQEGIGALRTGLVTVLDRSPEGRFSQRETLSAIRSPGPQVAVGPSGETLMVFNDAAAVGAEPGQPSFFWTARPEGGSFGPVQVLPGLGQGPLVMRSDGTAVVVWGSTQLQAIVRPPGGSFHKPELVTRKGQFPVLASRSHSVVAVWLADGRLMAARRSGG